MKRFTRDRGHRLKALGTRHDEYHLSSSALTGRYRLELSGCASGDTEPTIRVEPSR